MKSIVLLTALALAGCAPMGGPQPGAMASGPTATGGQCFYTNLVNGSRSVGPEAVHLRVRVSEIWRLELQTRCPGLELSSNTIGLKQRAGGTGRICSPDDLDVVSVASNVPVTCAVRSIRRLDPAEVAALADNARP